MRFSVLISLSLCFLYPNAPMPANAGGLHDGRELSNDAILRILMKDSKIKYPSNRTKVAGYSLILSKAGTRLSGKERREIVGFLLPNIQEVRRWTNSHGFTLRDRFREAYKRCLADILRGHPDIGRSRAMAVADRVAGILIP